MSRGSAAFLLLSSLFTLLTGCGLLELEQVGAPPGTSATAAGPRETELHAQKAEAIQTMGIDRLQDEGLLGQGVSILLMAPFKAFRPGTNVPVGFYLEQLVQAVAPAARVIPCDTGGDFFNLDPVQFGDCLLEALFQKPDIVVVGAMSWDTQAPGCDDLLDGRLARSELLVFAGAGDSSAEGLAYPACVPGVIPVLATYDADQSGQLPYLRGCWRESIHKDELACFTNYLEGRTLLAAPGAIVTLDLFGVDIPYCCSTAIAATLLGAGVALLLEAYPGASIDKILQALRETGVPIKDRGGSTVGVRAALYRAYLLLGETLQPEPEPTPDPNPSPSRSAKDFDLDENCLIDAMEFSRAVEAWAGGEIDNELFFKVLDAWVSQANVCL